MEKDYQGFIFNKISADVVAERKGKKPFKKIMKTEYRKRGKSNPTKKCKFQIDPICRVGQSK